MSNTIQVRILGRDYSLRSQQSQEQVQRIADFIDELLQETIAGRTVDTRDAAALTLLNLAGRYLQLAEQQGERHGEQQQLDSQLEELVLRLEREVSSCEKY
ncbi:cell division protein ZapA [Malonomonas rubra DSM 5091]|uniref:Cell division protein ZapA n=1 Tax=Malonomonas rubra DSM 5091 TaxID=1122189 RepID=A0A1M6MWT1_MALRU|nr:cell division protein ZapA [Malonomonas rubra]SHJ87884.1 cell division protein ZapA [Malonomonas rubra DSM 5091]